MGWEVERHREPPARFHARELPPAAARAVWVCEPDGAALVLGSTQPETVADAAACAAAGVDVVRRHSGGGAVLVVPGEVVWLDVIVPAGDPLWDVDVGRAFHWLGDTWAAALAAMGVEAVVHRHGLLEAPWSRLVCFAGVGAGEVLTPAGAKVVGLAQRRTRAAARFQCAALLRWDPAALVGLLALPPEDRALATEQLAGVASALPVEPDALLAAFLHQLPR